MPITIKDTIPGSGKQWSLPEVLARFKWISENFKKEEYTSWYGGLKSDDFYIRFEDEQNALIYKLKWCGSNVT